MKNQRHQIWKILKTQYCLQCIKVKIQYCHLEVTEVVLESKIFKFRDAFRATYDWLILFSS